MMTKKENACSMLKVKSSIYKLCFEFTLTKKIKNNDISYLFTISEQIVTKQNDAHKITVKIQNS